jgi:hypothetical protein
MADKLSKEEVRRIIEEQMPNFRVVQTYESPGRDANGGKTRARPEAHTPDIKTLRRKYLREKFLEGTDVLPANEPNEVPAADSAIDDTEIVLVEPKTAPHPLDRGSRPKTVVISTKDKKIIGTQG